MAVPFLTLSGNISESAVILSSVVSSSSYTKLEIKIKTKLKISYTFLNFLKKTHVLWKVVSISWRWRQNHISTFQSKHVTCNLKKIHSKNWDFSKLTSTQNLGLDEWVILFCRVWSIFCLAGSPPSRCDSTQRGLNHAERAVGDVH